MDDDTLEIDNRNCVKCMHCLNVVPEALSPGDDKGITLLLGGKRTLKIGDLMGTVIVPFMKLETDEDYERLVEIAELENHPFMLGSQFHPEFTSTPRTGHPLFAAYIKAALAHQHSEAGVTEAIA